MTMSARIGFITDCEGNYDYWTKCIELSGVVSLDDEDNLQFSRTVHADSFVFGGDVFDKGPGDIRIASQLVNFKQRYPDRVWLLAGNRDLNKLRLTAELAEDHIDVPQPVPEYPRAPPQLALRSFLEQRAREDGHSELSGDGLQRWNTKANRLRWILDHTMTAKGAFETRRQELALLCGRNVSDEDVLASFLDSVHGDDGFVWRYLSACSFAVLLGDTLVLHGGLPKDAIGWIPPLDMSYTAPQPGDNCGGTQLPDSHSLQEWVDAMNNFLQEGLSDFRRGMYWRNDVRHRGGEALLCMTSTPACFRRSIVVESLLQGGMPMPFTEEVDKYLSSHGVKRLLCGHKPCGDSPFVVRGHHVDVVHCDTTFSEPRAVAAVDVDAAASRLHLRGSLSDGREYDFWLPDEPFIGRQTTDGGWIKAVLSDGSYHIAFGETGGRQVRYVTRPAHEVALLN